MTYGQLRLRVSQLFPSINPDVLEGWISDCYQDILAELSWSRQTVQGMLLTNAPYTTGTVAVTQGSNAVTGTGTTWIAGMTGRAFRVTGRDEYYEFTFTGATTATLDRVFEGPTAATAGYSVFQAIYSLPSNCRLLPDDAFSNSFGGLTRISHGQLNDSAPTRSQTGTPLYWASYMDDGSTPPGMQVELYPVPSTAVGIPFTYLADSDSPTATATIMQVWLEPSALIQRVVALAKADLKDYTGAQLANVAAANALKQMRANEARRMGPAELTLSDYYTRHRAKRWCR
jgi:hypothetical protein